MQPRAGVAEASVRRPVRMLSHRLILFCVVKRLMSLLSKNFCVSTHVSRVETQKFLR